MKELDEILVAYAVARDNGETCLLATLVKVEGSSYRRAGARMLLTSTGKRCGSISGGCLEAEVQKKAWWLTEQGPALQRYRTTSEEETGVPFGMGCSGTLHILLKRLHDEDAILLEQLTQLRKERTICALATVLNGTFLGRQFLYPVAVETPASPLQTDAIQKELKRVAETAASEYVNVDGIDIFLEALPPRPHLVIFGAGDDVRPLVKFARLLGWDITVADARAHLATTSRFPEATKVICSTLADLPSRCTIRDEDSVVIMTHSYEQDCSLLRSLLNVQLRYLGLLGPRYRTRRIVSEIGSDLPIHNGLGRLHSPIGLDIGAHTPETIALAIIAEVQSVLTRSEASAVKDHENTESALALR